jgi:signal transduction histidine kinase
VRRDIVLPRWRADAALAAAVLLASAAIVVLGGASTLELRSPWWALVAVVQCGALVLRRRAPGWALGVAWAGVALQLLPVQGIGPQDVAVLIVAYSAAAYGGRAVRLAGLASALLGGALGGWFIAVALPAATGREPGPLGFLMAMSTSVFALAWTVGMLMAVIQKAQADRTAAAVAAERARHDVAVEEERARIARDTHDVVAHSLTVMIAQAEGARFVAEAQGGTSPVALTAIAETGRTALAEVRGLLAELRDGARDSPRPSFTRLPALLRGVEESGLSVELAVVGEPRSLSAAVDMASYRIVQESLTNALRHGDLGRPAQLRIEWRPESLRLHVVNTMAGAGARPTGGEGARRGHGLIGMTQRALLVGGELVAHRSASSRFEVVATLPYRVEEHG